jgi:hypothetical protein
MRTIYENQSHRDNEQAVANLISREKNLTLVKLHMKDRLDYVAFRGDRVRCFIEVRCRNISSTMHSDIMPCYFFVQWIDRLGYIKFDEECRLNMGGRVDRGDQQDIELCTYFETSRFKNFTRVPD